MNFFALLLASEQRVFAKSIGQKDPKKTEGGFLDLLSHFQQELKKSQKEEINGDFDPSALFVDRKRLLRSNDKGNDFDRSNLLEEGKKRFTSLEENEDRSKQKPLKSLQEESLSPSHINPKAGMKDLIVSKSKQKKNPIISKVEQRSVKKEKTLLVEKEQIEDRVHKKEQYPIKRGEPLSLYLIQPLSMQINKKVEYTKEPKLNFNEGMVQQSFFSKRKSYTTQYHVKKEELTLKNMSERASVIKDRYKESFYISNLSKKSLAAHFQKIDSVQELDRRREEEKELVQKKKDRLAQTDEKLFQKSKDPGSYALAIDHTIGALLFRQSGAITRTKFVSKTEPLSLQEQRALQNGFERIGDSRLLEARGGTFGDKDSAQDLAKVSVVHTEPKKKIKKDSPKFESDRTLHQGSDNVIASFDRSEEFASIYGSRQVGYREGTKRLYHRSIAVGGPSMKKMQKPLPEAQTFTKKDQKSFPLPQSDSIVESETPPPLSDVGHELVKMPQTQRSVHRSDGAKDVVEPQKDVQHNDLYVRNEETVNESMNDSLLEAFQKQLDMQQKQVIKFRFDHANVTLHLQRSYLHLQITSSNHFMMDGIDSYVNQVMEEHSVSNYRVDIKDRQKRIVIQSKKSEQSGSSKSVIDVKV